MVDIVGPTANQVSSNLVSKNVDSVNSGREKKVSLNSSSPSSTEVVDEVSISNTAMEIGRVMEIVQEARARVESSPSLTLSNDSERLNMLL